jgi:hypothetical protein
MKRVFLVGLLLMFAAPLWSQNLVAKRLEFTYGNAVNSQQTTVGDTLTGVSTDSDNVVIDLTLSGPRGQFEYYPEVVMLIVAATDISSGEGLSVQMNQGIQSIFEYNATLDTLLTAPGAGNAVRFYNTLTSTSTPATQMMFTFKAYASAADTDSLSYRVAATGLYRVVP